VLRLSGGVGCSKPEAPVPCGEGGGSGVAVLTGVSGDLAPGVSDDPERFCKMADLLISSSSSCRNVTKAPIDSGTPSGRYQAP
jgi:hypothetical protein